MFLNQINNFLAGNNIYEKLVSDKVRFKSGFRQDTETALVKVVNDLRITIDRNVSIPVLLHLSAAFDPVAFDPVDGTKELIDLSGMVLNWFRTY